MSDLDPLNTDATVALSEALAVRGNNADALGVLDQYLDDLGRPNETAPAQCSIFGGELPKHREGCRTNLARSLHLLAVQGSLVISTGGLLAVLANRGSWPSLARPALGARLMNEAGRLAAVHGIRCVEYRSSAHGEERPLMGLLDLLPHLLALPGAVGCHPTDTARLRALACGTHSDTSIPEDNSELRFRFATIRRATLDLLEAIVSECAVVLLMTMRIRSIGRHWRSYWMPPAPSGPVSPWPWRCAQQGRTRCS